MSASSVSYTSGKTITTVPVPSTATQIRVKVDGANSTITFTVPTAYGSKQSRSRVIDAQSAILPDGTNVEKGSRATCILRDGKWIKG
jgi:hypothetical protein